MKLLIISILFLAGCGQANDLCKDHDLADSWYTNYGDEYTFKSDCTLEIPRCGLLANYTNNKWEFNLYVFQKASEHEQLCELSQGNYTCTYYFLGNTIELKCGNLEPITLRR